MDSKWLLFVETRYKWSGSSRFQLTGSFRSWIFHLYAANENGKGAVGKCAKLVSNIYFPMDLQCPSGAAQVVVESLKAYFATCLCISGHFLYFSFNAAFLCSLGLEIQDHH
jgi:hypothetical protein